MVDIRHLSKKLLSEALSPGVIGEKDLYDSLVIGAGPAGLTAGIYLGRYLRKNLVIDGGEPRASWIPTSRNFPAWPNGIHGWQLLELMREQAISQGANIEAGRATNARKIDGLFHVDLNDRTVRSRTMLIATGIKNIYPSCIDERTRKIGTSDRTIRWCPICDPPELNSRIAIIGSSGHGVREALFMRTYTNDITIIPAYSNEIPDSDKQILDRFKIKFIDTALQAVNLHGNSITVKCSKDVFLNFSAIYPSMGSKIYNQLLIDLGAVLDPTGVAIVDDHCRTNVAGLYAAGDITTGLDQIDTATSQASIASTDMHNLMRKWDSSIPDNKVTIPIKGGEINH